MSKHPIHCLPVHWSTSLKMVLSQEDPECPERSFKGPTSRQQLSAPAQEEGAGGPFKMRIEAAATITLQDGSKVKASHWTFPRPF